MEHLRQKSGILPQRSATRTLQAPAQPTNRNNRGGFQRHEGHLYAHYAHQGWEDDERPANHEHWRHGGVLPRPI